ncbi:MAG TPA: NAD(P)-dependent oxidoreductase [Vicinamibacterales bacterium]|jgi:nucleoside-diphosphate-sugar epimerase
MNRSANDSIIQPNEQILITGSNGFIGTRLVQALIEHGFRNLRCLVRSRNNRTEGLFELVRRHPDVRLDVVEGNLISRADAARVAAGAVVVYHLAAGMEKSFPGSFLNTVVTTRNLLDEVCGSGVLKRFVNVSSLAVYTNRRLRRHAMLDEACELESHLVERDEPYVYAKLKQDELVLAYGGKRGLPFVILRPGAVYGPGKPDLTSRVGIGTFGIYLHLGGRNQIPFTHVINCADAIALAGFRCGIDGQTFNVIDDDLPTSSQFWSGYRRHVGRKAYLPVPYPVFYAFCALWEKYARWSEGQIPAAFNRARCSAYWKGNRYSNQKLKELLQWQPTISYQEGVRGYYEYLRAQVS